MRKAILKEIIAKSQARVTLTTDGTHASIKRLGYNVMTLVCSHVPYNVSERFRRSPAYSFATVFLQAMMLDGVVLDIIIDFAPVEGKCAEDIAEYVKGVIVDFNIKDRLLALAVDNVESNTKAIALVEDWLVSENIDIVIGLHSRCSAHWIQLCIKGGLKVPIVAEVFDKVHTTLAHIGASTASGRLEFFDECGDGPVARPPVANQTRWGTKFREGEYYLKNVCRITKYVLEAPAKFKANQLSLCTREDLAVLETALDVIRPLEVITKQLENKDAGVMAAEWFIDLWITMEQFAQTVANKTFSTRLRNAWQSKGIDSTAFRSHQQNPAFPVNSTEPEDLGSGPPSPNAAASSSCDEDNADSDNDTGDEGIEVDLDQDLTDIVEAVATSAVEGVLVVWNRYFPKFNPGMFVAHVVDPRYLPIQ